MVSRRPEVCILVAGDGWEWEYLRFLAGDMGIAGNVHFLSDRRDMPRVLTAMDVFVLGSLNEGFGRVIVEAMAAGSRWYLLRWAGRSR